MLLGKFNELTAAQQAEVDRKATLPKAAGDYKIELPEGFKLPEGSQIDTKDPAWGQFAEFAHRQGWSQDVFSEAAGIYAGLQLQASAARLGEAKAEFAKLGDSGPARVTAVHQFIDATFKGDEAAAAKASLVSSGAVAVWERMQAAITSAGLSFNQSGREGAPDPSKIEGYDKMSWTEKYNLSKQRSGKAA